MIQPLAETYGNDHKWKNFDQQNDSGENRVCALHPGASGSPEKGQASIKDAGGKCADPQDSRPAKQCPIAVEPQQVEQQEPERYVVQRVNWLIESPAPAVRD